MPITFTSSGNGGGLLSERRGAGGKLTIYTTPIPDIIRVYLTGSSAGAYDSASVNMWVRVTRAEYDSVAAGLSSVTKIGATDSEVNTRLVATTWNLTQTDDFIVPAGSYVFGMILEPWNMSSSGGVGYTTAVTQSIETYNTYFGHGIVGVPLGGGRNYYILKRPPTPIATDVYPFVTMSNSPNAVAYDRWNWSGTVWQYQPSSSVSMAKFQLLTTQVKQW